MRMRPILKTLGMALMTAAAMNLQPLSAQNIPVTDSEAEKISISLEESINHGDLAVLNQLIYFPEFIKRTGSRSNLIDNADTLTKIAYAFGLFNIGNGILETAKNGSFSLVHRYVQNEEVHLLFRAFGDDGLNYEEITLIKVKDAVRAADIFSYQLGESYAKLFSYLIDDNKSPDAHLSMTSREKYGSIFENALKNKNYSVARSAFEKFDDQTQNDKHLSLQYMLACKHLGEKLFRKSVDRFIALFPEEPTAYLLMMEAYADTKEYADYGGAIDKLDTLLHIDPFLNYLRGNLVMKMGDLAGGLHYYETVFEYDPGIWQNTEKLVACKVRNNELVEANDAIKLYCRTPGYKKDLVESLYVNFPALK
jgi:tetratricopeptide (TPR) repeat protein